MTGDSKLAMLPQFSVRAIATGIDTTLVDGSFSQPALVAVGDRGWLFVSETESSIGDVVTLDGDGARLDVPNWSMTRHVQVGAVLAWLDSYWQARDVALLLDETKQWRRVQYQPSDAAVFAQLVPQCPRCGWTGTVDTDLRHCRKCSAELKQVEIFGNQEASFPLKADRRLVEIQSGGWNHDHCLICDLAIGRDSPGATANPRSLRARTRSGSGSASSALRGS